VTSSAINISDLCLGAISLQGQISTFNTIYKGSHPTSTMSDLVQQEESSIEEMIALLQANGASLIQSILALKQGFNISLAEAREKVLQSSHWAEAQDTFDDMVKTFIE
jgi:hypothetical protein